MNIYIDTSYMKVHVMMFQASHFDLFATYDDFSSTLPLKVDLSKC